MRLTIIFTLIACLFCACSPEKNAGIISFGKISRAPTLENPQEVVIATYAGPHTYYLNADNQYAGLEYDLAESFSKTFAPEYKVKFIVAKNAAEITSLLRSGKADIAAASLPLSYATQRHFQAARPYLKVKPMLVYNDDVSKKPKDISSLTSQRLAVANGSGFESYLQKLKLNYPQLNWQKDQRKPEMLLTDVANGKLSYTIANSHLVSLMQNFYPNLQEAYAVGNTEQLAWTFAPEADHRLKTKVNLFFEKIDHNGQLRNLIDRHYGHAERLSEIDIRYFLAKVDETLPEYKAIFQKAGKATGINWRLLAALSYRESHWDPENTSPTKVRGLMMLTENTASALGVTNRLDPEQSIPAAAKYILRLKARFPSTIHDQDRTYFALAAYNIGYAHVQDARILAKRLKLNPDTWVDVKKTLVLLNNPKYYNSVKYGYASGGAPVILVETVRSYQHILEKYQPSRAQIQSGFFIAAR